MSNSIDFSKGNGLVPAIIQDANTRQVLMLGYMDQAAFDKTLEEGRITFFSRSKQRLWTKGETSGNHQGLVDWKIDCDQDTLLFQVRPKGSVCHTGSTSCFGEKEPNLTFLSQLEQVISQRKTESPETSYTSRLLSKGINKVAQKVGEEAVELVIEAKDEDKDLFLGEAADLLYHFMVLLAAKEVGYQEVLATLEARHQV